MQISLIIVLFRPMWGLWSATCYPITRAGTTLPSHKDGASTQRQTKSCAWHSQQTLCPQCQQVRPPSVLHSPAQPVAILVKGTEV